MHTQKNTHNTSLSTLEDVVQQTHRCLQYIAERECEPEDELRLLLQMCCELPESIVQHCPQIQEVIELNANFEVLTSDIRMALPIWILDDLSIIDYHSNTS